MIKHSRITVLVATSIPAVKSVELWLARRLFQKMNDLLSEGAVLALGAFLKPLVKSVREVLDVERRHGLLLHTASILEGHES